MSSLWLAESSPFEPIAELPSTTAVAVLGAGIAGISTALHLAQRGIDVVVLEQAAVGSRASGRNDGQLLLGLGEHYHRIHGQFGTIKARQLWDFLRDNHDALRRALAAAEVDCELMQRGGLRLAETAHEWQELQEAAALLAGEAKPHTLVPASDLQQWLQASVGFHGALYLPGEAIVQPVKMVRGLARAAAAAGARIVERASVTAVEGDAGDFTVRLADGRSLACSIVVHCTSTLARELDTSGLLARTVFPFRGQVIATDALPAHLAGQFPPHAMSSNFCYEYFRLSRGRFLIGGKRWSVPGEELGILDDSTHNPQVTTNLLAYVHAHFPQLREVPFPHVWTGIMAGTPDGLPLVGALPGRPGTFALLAFNGYGLSFAFLAGSCLAEMIVDGQSRHPSAHLFAPRRLQQP